MNTFYQSMLLTGSHKSKESFVKHLKDLGYTSEHEDLTCKFILVNSSVNDRSFCRNGAFALQNGSQYKRKHELDLDIPEQYQLAQALAAMQNNNIPHKGEIMVMERNGGFSYHPDNNGCLAVLTEVKESTDSKIRFRLTGNVLNPKKHYETHFTNCFYANYEGQRLCRKATEEELYQHFIKSPAPFSEQSTITYRVKSEYSKHSKALFDIAIAEKKVDEKGGWGRFTDDSVVKKFYEEAGLLDKWFDKVEEPMFKTGDIVVIEEEWPDKIRKSEIEGKVATIKDVIKPNSGSYMTGYRYTVHVPNYQISSVLVAQVRAATLEEIENAKEVKVAGYKAVIEKDGVHFGCQTIEKPILESLLLLMNKKFKTELVIEGDTVTKEQIQTLLNRM